MKSKVIQNKQIKLEKLLNSAYELFMTKGIHDTSINEITTHAGVAKGTFYLYFHDKYSIRDSLISRCARKLFLSAHEDLLKEENLNSFEDKFIYITDHIIKELEQNKPLLAFISKNLSWGLFRQLVQEDLTDDHITGLQMFNKLAEENHVTLKDPDIMVFLVVEMVSASAHSAILGNAPISMDKLLPYINETIRSIIHNHLVQ